MEFYYVISVGTPRSTVTNAVHVYITSTVVEFLSNTPTTSELKIKQVQAVVFIYTSQYNSAT